MPKIVENYILERKIGSGQFGDVYKGYNRLNNQDIAVKVVQRKLIKGFFQMSGKFNELLENEIKVLRTCNNENIIKLYDIKKTANNFYLILEFCNEGDLSEYLKQKGYLTEDEAVEFLLQILNAFKTLVILMDTINFNKLISLDSYGIYMPLKILYMLNILIT